MPLPSELVHLDRESSREIIYRQLKTLILDLTLEPLEVLRDGELAKRLGVSRTPVREALRKLEDEGFVQSQRNQWTRVSGVELRSALEIYPVAQSLQVTALRLAFPNLTRTDIQALRVANNAMREAIRNQHAADALKFDAGFHRVIIDRARNPVLLQLLTSLTEKLYRIELAHFSHAESGRASVDEHRALIRAIQAGNLDEALEQMTANWACPYVDGAPIHEEQ
jgi:DNA-binding GntR family transcriptional regulator